MKSKEGQEIWDTRFPDVGVKKNSITRRKISCLFGMHECLLIITNEGTMRICKNAEK